MWKADCSLLIAEQANERKWGKVDTTRYHKVRQEAHRKSKPLMIIHSWNREENPGYLKCVFPERHKIGPKGHEGSRGPYINPAQWEGDGALGDNKAELGPNGEEPI